MGRGSIEGLPMTDTNEILEMLGAMMPRLRKEFAVATLGLFGSAARGDDGPESDVDLLVTFEPGAKVSLFTLARLKDVLESALGREVDLVEDHAGLDAGVRRTISRDLRRVA
jgi:predicted nucleotidyltransferase